MRATAMIRSWRVRVDDVDPDGAIRWSGRDPARAPPRSDRQVACDTDDMLNPSTVIGGIAVRVNQSLHSRDRVGTVAPTSAACRSTSSGDMLKRKLLTAPTTSPP